MFALCEPEPFTVATCRLMSLMMGTEAVVLMGLLGQSSVAPWMAQGQRPGDGSQGCTPAPPAAGLDDMSDTPPD